jgi:DNA repair protein RecN (Recombination protein N)
VEKELEALSGSEERLRVVENELKEEAAQVQKLSGRLTKERKQAASAMADELEKELKALRMDRTRFEARIQPFSDEEGFGPAGADRIDFLISPNPGEEPRPLSRIASGGELSRIMLALKVILNDLDRVPSLVFDEVDAGIGGAVAEVVGQRLKSLSRKRQVFCITHLPQIAAHAADHVVIEKRVEEGRTVTRAVSLSDAERVEEIARMLGGRQITATTRKHAQEMLGL